MAMQVADAIPLFLEHMKGRGLKPGTVSRHRYALSGRGGFLGAVQKVKGSRPTMGQVDHECVARWLASLTRSQGDRNNKLESLRQFLNWAERTKVLRPGFTAEDLLTGYKSRRYEREPKYYIPAEDFPRALDLAGERDPRDRAVIAFLLGTLARDSEAAPAQLRHLDLDGLSVELFREKRSRWTTTGINPAMAEEMETWGDYYAREMGYFGFRAMRAAHPEWLILPARCKGCPPQPLNPTAPISVMSRIVKRLLTDLGVTETRNSEWSEHLGEGVHTIRRSGGAALFDMLSAERGFDGAALMVQAMLDHESAQMTLLYIGRDRVKDQLNDWLRGNSMYSTPPGGTPGQVIPMRRHA